LNEEQLVLQLEVYLNILSRQVSLTTSVLVFYQSVSLGNM